jgi:murein DD-endopeptidase MepM/ murein hydrolase activator NlpD
MRLLHLFILITCAYFISHYLFAGDDALELSGNFIQGGLVVGKVIPGSRIKINGHMVRVSTEGDFIIGFGRDYPANSTLTILELDGNERQHTLQIAQREYKVQHIDGLPKAQVSPDEKTLVRIKQENKKISQARSMDEARLDFKTEFIWPSKGPITGVFGSQRILNGEPRQPHYGIDVAAPVGTPVVAPAAGVVSYVGDMYFSGGTLVLDHGHRLSSSFLHLEKVLVKVGQRVKQGEKIALVGATGRVTGAHLDWRMNWHGQRIDPGLLMDEIP